MPRTPKKPKEAPQIADSDLKMPTRPLVTTHRHGYILLIILVIVLVIILAGLHSWQKSLVAPVPIPTPRPTAEMNNEPESTTAEAAVETLQAMSSSNDLNSITADLEATIITDPAANFAAIEAELAR